MLRVFVKGCSFPILDISIYSVCICLIPPHFQNQNRKACSASREFFFHQLVFHFVTKPREEQLERPTLYFQPGVRFDIHAYY